MWGLCSRFSSAWDERMSTPNLSRMIERFARRLRSNFQSEIARNPGAFKRRAASFLRRHLPPQAGRPCSDSVTRAFRLRSRNLPWPKIYRICLPTYSGDRARFNLRVAVRMRRLRLKRQGKQNRRTNVSLAPSASRASSCRRKEKRKCEILRPRPTCSNG